MNLIEKLAQEYYEKRPEGFGEPTEDFMAGFRKARDMIVAKVRGEIGDAGLQTVGVDPQFGESSTDEESNGQN